ncbi:MAG: hypothetical protein WAK53_18320 [Chromatiaceae bacterium]
MDESNEVLTEASLERRTRRRFSLADKQRLLAEADVPVHGEQGAWPRRNGLYGARLSRWREARERNRLTGYLFSAGDRIGRVLP